MCKLLSEVRGLSSAYSQPQRGTEELEAPQGHRSGSELGFGKFVPHRMMLSVVGRPAGSISMRRERDGGKVESFLVYFGSPSGGGFLRKPLDSFSVLMVL